MTLSFEPAYPMSLFTADSNECLDGNGGCSHQCINTFRSYKCTCPKGMILQANGKTCFLGMLLST